MRIIAKIIGVILFVGASFSAVAFGEEQVEVRSLGATGVSPAAKIEQLSWLSGYWEGEGLGGKAVENIAPQADGQMMGAFYSLKGDGTLNFYEFYVFAEVGDTLSLRIKHFSPALVGWEEKDKFVEFPLVAIEPETVYFDGITFTMTGPDQMMSAVNIDGQSAVYFVYERKKLE